MLPVTVLIPTFNGREDLLAAIESVFAGEPPAHIVVIDNGSTENVAETVLARWPTVVWLQNERNMGFGRACNRGAVWFREMTDDAYLFLLNDDAKVAPDTLQTLVKVAEKAPQFGLLSPEIRYLTMPTRAWFAAGRLSSVRGTAVHLDHSADVDSHGIRRVGFIPGCAVLVRRALVGPAGLFDERYFHGGEDVDLCIRAQEDGWVLGVVPDALAWHRVSTTAKRVGRPFTWYHMTRNRVLIWRKHGRGLSQLGFCVVYPIQLSWWITRFVVQGQFQAARAVVLGALDGLLGRFDRISLENSEQVPQSS